MSLLYLTPGCFDKGGISRYSRYQVTALRQILGADKVTVFSLLGPDAASFEGAFDVSWHGSGANLWSKGRYCTKALGRILASRPSLIWSAHVNLSALGCILAGLCRSTSVLNVYGLEVWSGLRHDALWGFRKSDEVISDCHFTANYIEGEGIRPAGSTEVIWDCVDLAKFSPAPPRPSVLKRYGIPGPEVGFNILTLGRMDQHSAHKGYSRLLDAFGAMAPDIPEASLIFAGRGELGAGLRERAAEMGLQDRVFFTGMVHEDDLPDVYRSAHVFSLISDRGYGRGEGIPLTPLEAAACGVPILVGNQDGSQEAVLEGVNGYALEPFDLDAHVAVLSALAKDTCRRREMGIAARRRIEKDFSFEGFRDKHRCLLKRWLQKSMEVA